MKDNKLIAEFMAVGYDGLHPYTILMLKDNQDTEDVYFQTYFHYHHSWDWLMRVVEQIESMNVSVTITYKYCFIEAEDQSFNLMQDDSNCGKNKLESTYMAVVEFIKHYNKNK